MLFKFIQKLFKRKLKPFQEGKGVEFAFRCGGINYYKYSSEFQMPVERALTAKDFYEELEQRIEREYLKSLFEAVQELANRGKLVQIANLVKIAQDKLSHITNAEIALKLASVLYFDESENVRKVDLAYCERKIAHWKQHGGADFFLNKPIADLLPSSLHLGGTIQRYMEALAEEELRELEYLSRLLSEMPERQDLRNFVALRIQKYAPWAKSEIFQ